MHGIKNLSVPFRFVADVRIFLRDIAMTLSATVTIFTIGSSLFVPQCSSKLRTAGFYNGMFVLRVHAANQKWADLRGSS